MIRLLAACLFMPILNAAGLSGDEILGAVVKTSTVGHSAVYSGRREYSIQNRRFGKSATAEVRISSRPGVGKQFTIIRRSGSPKLISVIEALLASEADASKPDKSRTHEIGASNYNASLLGTETVADRDCWILALRPKSKSKYLLKGTAWVDKSTGALVRLDGTTAANVSNWVGAPHIIEEFAPIGGVWLPVHTVSKSTSLLLGESELDIQYMDYDITCAELRAGG
jgi:MucB/RseB N-terminal domain